MRVLMLLLAFSLPLLAADHVETQTFDSFQQYFIANQAAIHNGKTGEPTADAILHTSQGPVQFTSQGAFISAPVATQSARERLNPREQLRESGKQKVQQIVVLQTGFANDTSQKRGLKPRLTDPKGATLNRFVGPQEQWQRDMPMYDALTYDQVWQGIDVRYRTHNQGMLLEWELTSAQVQDIHMLTGATTLTLKANGSLTAEAHGLTLQYATPTAYQVIDGQRHAVDVAFTTKADGAFGLSLGAYRNDLPLKMETQVTWSTFFSGLGGTSLTLDINDAIATLPNGNVVVAGTLGAGDFPVTPGVYQSQHNGGGQDIFVAVFAGDGSGLVYATYFGGNDFDTMLDVEVTAANEVIVLGRTASTDLPLTADNLGSELPTSTGGQNFFITKFNATGNALEFMTLFGGPGRYLFGSLKIDAQDNLHLAGITYQSTFPITVDGLSKTESGSNSYYAIINASATSLLYSSYLPYAGLDVVDFEIGPDGHVTFAGWAYFGYETTEGAYNDLDTHDDYQLGILKLDGTTREVIYAAAIGFGDFLYVHDLEVDAQGRSVVAGEGVRNGFVLRLSADGSSLDAIRWISSQPYTRASAVAFDSSDRIYVSGSTSNAIYVSDDAWRSDREESGEGFLRVYDAELDLIYSSYIGGSGLDACYGIALSQSGEIWLAGHTNSPNLPTTANAVQTELTGAGGDIFLMKFAPTFNQLEYATYLGGSDEKAPELMTSDAAGNTYLAGTLYGDNYSTTDGAYVTDPLATTSLYVAKFDATTKELVYLTSIGADSGDNLGAMVADDSGNLFLVGSTDSANFPTTAGAYSQSLFGENDAFALKLNSDGSNLDYATLFGGDQNDYATAADIDASGALYIGGRSNSWNISTTPGVVQGLNASSEDDAFVVKLVPDGSNREFATFLGGAGDEYVYDLAVDASGQVHLAGDSRSDNLPTTSGALRDTASSGGFLAKFNATATDLIYATYLGWSGTQAVEISSDQSAVFFTNWRVPDEFLSAPGFSDGGYAHVGKLSLMGDQLEFLAQVGGFEERFSQASMDLGANDEIIIAGRTRNENLPTTQNALHENFIGGSYDHFLMRLTADGSWLDYSTYFGTPLSEHALAGMRVADSGQIYLAGYTSDTTFMTTGNAISSQIMGGSDAFLMAFDLPDGCTPAKLADQAEVIQVCIDEDLTISPITTGTGPFAYQWYKDGVLLPGEEAGSLNLTGIQAEDQGVYELQIVNECSDQTFAVAEVTFGDPPEILELSASPVQLCASSVAPPIFVTASGAERLTYDVYRNGEYLFSPSNGRLNMGTSQSLRYVGEITFVVRDRCGQETETDPIIVLPPSPLPFSIVASTTAGGLSLPEYSIAKEDCGLSISTQFTWDVTPAVDFVVEGETMRLTQMPSETTTITLTASEPTRWDRTFSVQTQLLISPNGDFSDLNGDGCNSVDDLILLMQSWGQSQPTHDPDGDGQGTVLDALYIPTNGGGCNP